MRIHALLLVVAVILVLCGVVLYSGSNGVGDNFVQDLEYQFYDQDKQVRPGGYDEPSLQTMDEETLKRVVGAGPQPGTFKGPTEPPPENW